MSLDQEKSAARKAAFARRKEAHAHAAPGQAGVLSQVLAGYRGAPVAGYMPINTEISPIAAMEEASAHSPVAVPVITAKAQPLKFAAWDPETVMVSGAFGAAIPEQPEFLIPEIIVLPLVAFDNAGNRLGYGGGFYDRTLELLRANGPVLAIGFAFDAQRADHLPLEPTDQPLDMIVTERDVFSF